MSAYRHVYNVRLLIVNQLCGSMFLVRYPCDQLLGFSWRFQRIG